MKTLKQFMAEQRELTEALEKKLSDAEALKLAVRHGTTGLVAHMGGLTVGGIKSKAAQLVDARHNAREKFMNTMNPKKSEKHKAEYDRLTDELTQHGHEIHADMQKNDLAIGKPKSKS